MTSLGLGWRGRWHPLSCSAQDIGFVEVLAEPVSSDSASPLPLADARRRGIPIIPHGVSLDLGGADLRGAWRARLARRIGVRTPETGDEFGCLGPGGMIHSTAVGGEESKMAKVVTTRWTLMLLVAVLFGMLPGCAGPHAGVPAGKNFTEHQSSRFVLKNSDLPSTFKRVTSGTGNVACTSPQLANYGSPAETPGEAATKQQLLALSPQSCHLSIYNKEDASRGFLVLAIVFPTPEAASASLPLLRKPLSDPFLAESYAPDPPPTPATDLLNPGLGDESLPGIKRSTPGPSGDPPGRPVMIDHFWRVRNVAITLASTYDPRDDLQDTDIDRIARNISTRAVG